MVGDLPSVASKLGCTAQTLRKWVRQAEATAGSVRDCAAMNVSG